MIKDDDDEEDTGAPNDSPTPQLEEVSPDPVTYLYVNGSIYLLGLTLQRYSEETGKIEKSAEQVEQEENVCTNKIGRINIGNNKRREQ